MKVEQFNYQTVEFKIDTIFESKLEKIVRQQRNLMKCHIQDGVSLRGFHSHGTCVSLIKSVLCLPFYLLSKLT